MRVVVVGLGVQGYKRREIAGCECIATVDPINKTADYSKIEDVELDTYDAALVCTPDEVKLQILNYLIANGKHVLVEKPLLTSNINDILDLEQLCLNNNIICYTAYNHRFEPHYVRMRELIASDFFGEIYSCRLFYGNGTARLVRESLWRDKGAGVLPDLGSHMLDTLYDWFGAKIKDYDFNIIASNTFENKSPDHVIFADFASRLNVQVEMTLLSWRNHFTCDIVGEKGSAHIRSLCKWGPSTFTTRKRVFPSGRPPEESTTLVQSDPTWQLEYDYFKKLCKAKSQADIQNQFDVDKWIYSELNRMSKQALVMAKIVDHTKEYA